MKVAVLEYLCGGGLCNAVAPPEHGSHLSPTFLEPLYDEGLSMLSALAADFCECGHDVLIGLDRKAAADSMAISLANRFPHLQIRPMGSNWMEQWRELAMECDCVIPIAPELHQQLEGIVQWLRSAGANVLASSVPFLRATSDKLETARLLAAAQIRHPVTQSLKEFGHSYKHLSGWNERGPCTVKRRDGAGCIDMMVFANSAKAWKWMNSTSAKSLVRDEWIIQPWHSGRPASMAILASEAWQVLGAVKQHVDLTQENRTSGFSTVGYRGGAGPINEVSRGQLQDLATKLKHSLPSGAVGWIGVDFLIPGPTDDLDDLVVIEINPRLTTSYLGYRQWYGHRLADCMLGIATPERMDNSMIPQIEFKAG